jgi:hypothetical protein
LSQLLQ